MTFIMLLCLRIGLGGDFMRCEQLAPDPLLPPFLAPASLVPEEKWMCLLPCTPQGSVCARGRGGMILAGAAAAAAAAAAAVAVAAPP